MVNGLRAKAGLALATLGLTALAGCGSLGDSDTSLGTMILLAGPTVPPAQTVAMDDVYCPPVDVVDGGSAIQAYAGGRVGDASGLRSQIAISQLARECTGRPDGTTVVKVGVEGRALLGAGGGAGRYDVPVHIVIKRGSTVIANRSKRLAVAIPAGDSQATFSVVEEGIVVPAGDVNSFEIEVGLGAHAAAAGRRRG